MRVALLLLAVAPLAAQQLPKLPKIYPGPEQPLPFSHKTHAKQGVECKTCHAMPDPGVFADIAGTDTCMGCHSAVKSDSPAIQKLTAHHQSGRRINWEPVYLVADYVFFSHREHVEKAGASCSDCHGDVAQMDVVAKERDISMAACMSCHRAKNASLECDFCHESRGSGVQ